MLYLHDLFADLRYGARILARNPGFSAVAILTLALGIGANTAVFSLVSTIYLRQAPYPNAPRLVDLVRNVEGQPAGATHNSRRYLYFKERAQSFDEIAATRGGGDLNLIINGEAEQARTRRISANYFPALGVAPLMGRTFSAADDTPGSPDVAILSWSLWQRRFAGDPQILGKTVNLGGRICAVVAVMPRDFIPPAETDLWTPLRARPGNDGRNTTVIGLLKPGVTHEQASREMAALIAAYRRDFPSEEREFARDESAAVAPFDSTLRRSGTPLLMLFGAVSLTLLIACANLGNLLLARATARVREVAIRSTLGAGAGRIVRQLLAESVLIAALGAAAGLALAFALIPGLEAISPVSLGGWHRASIDWRVLAFTAALAIFTGLLFGSAPAWQVSRMDLNQATRDSGAKASAGRRAGRLRGLIVAVEIALSLMLMVGAGLFIRTFANLLAVRTGVDTTNVVTGQMALQGKRYETTAATSAFFKRGLERLQQHPAVESAAVVTNLPMERGLNLVTWIPGSDRPDDPKLTDWRYVSTDYFRVLRIATIAGRVFTGADHAASEPVAVINQEFARRYFGKQDPIGRSMQIMRQSPQPDRTRVIVGVVADVKSENFRRPAPPTVFIPLDQAPDAHMAIANAFFQASWVVRTRDSAGNIAAVMQRELKAVDPLQPFSGFRTLDEVRARAVRSDRSMMLLLGSFAALAIALAAAGIFGVIAYSVAQRTREIGIRMALGATAGVVVRSIVTSGAVLAAIGILAGIAGALALTRFVAAYVFGVQPADPLTFATASLLVLAVALAASLIPALRVTRLDPSRALRVD